MTEFPRELEVPGGERGYLESPSLGLCLRPASAAFALVFDLIVDLPKPLFCDVWELVKEADEFVTLEVMPAAEAISFCLGAGQRHTRGLGV